MTRRRILDYDVCISYRGVRSISKKRILLCMTKLQQVGRLWFRNCREFVECPFITITSKSLRSEAIRQVKILSRGQIDLFESFLYLMGIFETTTVCKKPKKNNDYYWIKLMILHSENWNILTECNIFVFSGVICLERIISYWKSYYCLVWFLYWTAYQCSLFI